MIEPSKLTRFVAHAYHNCRQCEKPRSKFIYVWVELADLSETRRRLSVRGASQQGLVFCSKKCWRKYND